MVKQKACRHCRTIFTGTKCPRCGADDGRDNFRGKIKVLNAENSEIARNLKLKEKGEYALRV